MPELQWLKSSFSEASANACVEVAATADGVALRESDVPDLRLSTDPAALRALVLTLKARNINCHRR
ncbi:DUF397 domain-containing protein [Streptomyces sp. E11-3]|uniref:DUF397 domain-containing protein n=1 Tax=Streptomyces sp. E11-3 TaxID=3110112 RepID=UPI0039814165